jgi:pectate lyase
VTGSAVLAQQQGKLSRFSPFINTMPSRVSATACALYFSLGAVGCSSDGNTVPHAGGGSDNQSGGTAAIAGGGTGNLTGGALSGGGASDTLAGTAGAPVSGGAEANGGAQTGAGGTSTAGQSASAGTTGTAGAGSTAEVSDGPLLAFPGAQGFGRNATGGRAGTVYHVTNLNDSGAGSFRDAVGTANRMVVFDVGGYIQLKTAVSAKSNLTIAGQTAPGGGIGFRGGEISFANSSNVIVRYLRIRPGSETASSEDDALSLFRAQNVMIDHCSFEFGPWNNIDAVSDDWEAHPVTNITIQDSLIADPTGQQFGAHMESVASQQAWYRNIFANSHNRNPLAKADTVFVNNLLYNYAAGYTTHTSTDFKHDILNNYFVFGPASTGTDNTWFQVDKNQAIYSAGNKKDTNLNGTLDGAETTPYWYQGEGTILPSAWSTETTATKPLDAASAARVALSLAGPLPRDAIDALIISQAMTLGKGTTGLGAGTAGPDGGLYTSQAQTGLANNGYGAITSGTKPTDTDNDGMSDDWERANGSDPKADDAMKKAPSGYTLIERYLNWLAAPHATSTAGAAVDVDLSAYASGFSAVSPTYAVAGAQNGTVSLGADKHSAHFQPNPGGHGLGAFAFSVTGSDNTTFTMTALVLAAP